MCGFDFELCEKWFPFERGSYRALTSLNVLKFWSFYLSPGKYLNLVKRLGKALRNYNIISKFQ